MVSQAELTVIGFTLGYAGAVGAAAPAPGRAGGEAENTGTTATRPPLAAPFRAPPPSA